MLSIANLGDARLLRRLSWGAGLGLLILGATGCNSSSSPQGGTNPPGTLVDHPDASTLTTKRFIADPNKGGKGSELRISAMYWGRLVDVFDRDADGTRELQHKEFVVGANIVSDGHDYLLETNALTGVEELTILHPFGGSDGIPSSDDAYQAAFGHLDGDLQPIEDAPIDGLGVFTLVPRNAALVIQFDDLLEPTLVNSQTLKIFTGNPPALPFTPRVFVDTNHGDVIQPSANGAPVFYSTRAIVDPTVSEIESFANDPPLALNGAGLPPSTNPNLANLVLRIPTLEKPGLGQEFVLRNPSGHKVATTGNGTVDFASATVDILRAMRSGGDTLVTGDPSNGYLRDEQPPSVVSVQPVAILAPPVPDPDGTEVDFILPQVQFLTVDCARDPRVGDLLRQSANFIQVREVSAPQNGGIAQDLKVRLLLGDPADFGTSGVGPAQYLAVFDPVVDLVRPECFVLVSPDSAGFPVNPNVGISTASSFSLRFSEAMHENSMRAFDSLLLTRQEVASSGTDYVVCRIQSSVNLKEFTLFPDLPLAHVTGTAEDYFLSLTTGDLGPSDLAGNGLADDLPLVTFTVDPTLAAQANGGHLTRFTSMDEEAPFGDDINGELPEWSGQHTYNPDRQSILPRSVIRFEAVADRTKPMILPMSNQPGGLGEPLTKYGNKLHAIWRPCDVDYRLIDSTTYNVDVEGLSWVPVGGLALADHFEQFEIRIAHSLFLPDETLDPLTGLPVWPNSGLEKIFETNPLNPSIDPLKIVHSRELGYTVSPGDIVVADTGTLVLPFPLNRGIPVSEYVHYTWRDTGLTARGAPEGGGAEVTNYRLGGAMAQPLMSANRVETIGLPLLMEFRCYPDDKAQGTNVLEVALAVAITTSLRPHFRAFSSGGADGNGGTIDRDPDLETEANGGFNPNSNPPGQATPGQDTVVYLGSIDLVTRVSRSYSIWFEAEGTASPLYHPPVVEPDFDDQPGGTSIEVAFRGASVASPDEVRQDATSLDFYGDDYQNPAMSRDQPNPQITFLDGDDQWHTDVSEIDGAPFYQIRLTFLSSAETGVSPELSGIGLTWIVP